MKKHMEQKHKEIRNLDYQCDLCEFKTDNDKSLKNHTHTKHQTEKGNRTSKFKCDLCIYQCLLEVQMKKHMEKKHIEKITFDYECDLCEFGGDLVTDIWSHKLDKHADNSLGYNKADEQAKSNMFFNFVAEQNLEVAEEVINLKSGMKQVIEQLINDFEDTMKDLKDEMMKQHEETTKAIKNLKDTMVNSRSKLKHNTKSTAETPSTSSPSERASTPTPASPTKSSETSNGSKTFHPKSKPKTENGNTQKPKPARSVKTKYQCKPRVLLVGDSLAHNSNFNKIEAVTNTTIKTAKAYSSAFDNSARYKEMNVTKVVKDELKESSFDHLVLAAPTVDITNLDTMKVNPADNTDFYKQKVGKSCQNMIKVAEEALANNSALINVTIMGHAPRFDKREVDPVGLKPNLANFANSFMLELWLDSPMKHKIFIGSHNLECSGEVMMKRYGDDRTGHMDGVHLYGRAGKKAYTESVLNILLSSLQSQAPVQPTKPANDDYHTRCAGTQHYSQQNRNYSSVVKGMAGVKIPTRFSSMGEDASSYHSSCPQTLYKNNKSKQTNINNIFTVPVKNKFDILGN